jgi:hypothetical protein
MTWQGIVVIIGAAVALAGVIALARPVPRLWISDRRRAALVLLAGLLIAGVGFLSARHCGCVLPPINPPTSSIGKQ